MIWLAPMLVGCVRNSTVLEQPYRFEARTTHGVIRVMPPLDVTDPTEVDTASYVGPAIPWMREWLRHRRTDEIDGLPARVGTSLPGALNHCLDEHFDATFLTGSYAPGVRTALQSALRGRGNLDATLKTAARGIEGDAVLISWVQGIDARPLTAEGFAGDIVHTAAGPVVIDFLDEPYLVEAKVGMALIARDGEVVLRYTDHFSTVLSARRTPRRAAKDLAGALAEEVSKVWATDPSLEDDAPSDRVVVN